MENADILTEQWKQNILPEGNYYIERKYNEDDSEIIIDHYEYYSNGNAFYTPDNYIIRVIRKVPTYDELCEMEYTEMGLQSELELVISKLYKDEKYQRWLEKNFPKEIEYLNKEGQK